MENHELIIFMEEMIAFHKTIKVSLLNQKEEMCALKPKDCYIFFDKHLSQKGRKILDKLLGFRNDPNIKTYLTDEYDGERMYDTFHFDIPSSFYVRCNINTSSIKFNIINRLLSKCIINYNIVTYTHFMNIWFIVLDLISRSCNICDEKTKEFILIKKLNNTILKQINSHDSTTNLLTMTYPNYLYTQNISNICENSNNLYIKFKTICSTLYESINIDKYNKTPCYKYVINELECNRKVDRLFLDILISPLLYYYDRESQYYNSKNAHIAQILSKEYAHDVEIYLNHVDKISPKLADLILILCKYNPKIYPLIQKKFKKQQILYKPSIDKYAYAYTNFGRSKYTTLLKSFIDVLKLNSDEIKEIIDRYVKHDKTTPYKFANKKIKGKNIFGIIKDSAIDLKIYDKTSQFEIVINEYDVYNFNALWARKLNHKILKTLVTRDIFLKYLYIAIKKNNEFPIKFLDHKSRRYIDTKKDLTNLLKIIINLIELKFTIDDMINIKALSFIVYNELIIAINISDDDVEKKIKKTFEAKFNLKNIV